jgi:CRISPR locus-related DNA-binding protein
MLQLLLLMERYIKENAIIVGNWENISKFPLKFQLKGVDIMGKKILIATLYKADAVLLAAHRLSADRLILLIDKTPNKEQEKAVKEVNDAMSKVMEISTIKCEVYDIVKVAEKCVELIDSQSKEDHIFINITSGRKTKAIGLLFAAYARHDRVSKIAYNPEEDKSTVVYLPRLSFKFTESQKKILNYLAESNYKSHTDLADKLDISRAMLYRAIDELKDMDMVETDNKKGVVLTDAGKIARL